MADKSREVKPVDFVSLWCSRVALTVLAFAGSMTLLASVDKIIAYAFSVVVVALLLKETL